MGKFQAEINGPLKGGDPGVRLIDGEGSDIASYFNVDLQPPTGNGFWLLPQQHIFGSEELSNQSESVAERSDEPALVLNPADAEGLGIVHGGGVQFQVGETHVSVMAITDPACIPGTVRVSVGTGAYRGDRFYAAHCVG